MRGDLIHHTGYDYQYLSCRGFGRGVGNAKAQLLRHAIERVWKGCSPKENN